MVRLKRSFNCLFNREGAETEFFKDNLNSGGLK